MHINVFLKNVNLSCCGYIHESKGILLNVICCKKALLSSQYFLKGYIDKIKSK